MSPSPIKKNLALEMTLKSALDASGMPQRQREDLMLTPPIEKLSARGMLGSATYVGRGLERHCLP